MIDQHIANRTINHICIYYRQKLFLVLSPALNFRSRTATNFWSLVRATLIDHKRKGSLPIVAGKLLMRSERPPYS